MKKQFNEAQCQAIAHFTGPCLTLAGPGSGKTTVIVERICRLLERGVPAKNILVLTFTRAAAVEMRERFLKRIEEQMAPASEEDMAAELVYRKTSGMAREASDRTLSAARQVLFGTFHSAFFQILRYSGGYDASSVLRGEEKYAFLEEVSRGVGIYHDREGWYQEVLKEISDVKGNAMEPEEFQPLSCTSKEFTVLYRGYQDLLQRRKKLDFDDMLLRCLHLFEERPDILEIWQERCQFIMIDEYQDSSRIQCRLAQMLAAPQNNIMVVGDDDQSIYGFRGAAPERMRDFLETYPESKQYLLNINYRCPETVVKAAGSLIGENQNRLPKEIRAAKIAEDPTITWEEHPTLLEENEAVIARIQSYHAAGIPYEDMAVLYRINRNPAQLLRLMESRGIPVQVKGTTGGPFHHGICQDFCAYLAAANGSTRRADWLRVISHPERYFSRSALGQEPVTLDKLFDYYSDDRRRIDTLDHLSYDMTLLRKAPPYAGLSHLRRFMGYDDYLAENDKSGEGRLQEIAEQLQETADGCRTGQEWLAYVERMRQGDSPRQDTGHQHSRLNGGDIGKKEDRDGPMAEEPGVHFMTMHGSKGLEFPVVFIVDANEGMTPYKRADSPEGIEEERRLFYVAMTRTKEHLHISWTKERFHRPQSRSRFVDEVGLWQEEPKKKSWRERLRK